MILFHKYKWLILLSFVICLFYHPSFSQKPIYKDSAQKIEARVTDLIKRMTLEEKFRQLFMVTGDLGKDSSRFKVGIFGLQINTVSNAEIATNQMMKYNPGQDALETVKKINSIQKFFIENTRLGIPVIFYDEALHGLVRKSATAFPQAIALAATFDTLLVSQVFNAVADECKDRGIRQVLSPVINLATDVRWGRVEETYGEDPFLVSEMGLSFIRAFESKGIVTTPKHFVVNHGDGGRDSYPVNLNERYLEETYFIPFKSAVVKGKVRSIMTAYNSLNGRPCSANNWLLNTKLKNDWGFKGFVISDAGATGGANVLHFTAKDYEDAGKQSIENGQDVIFQIDIDSYKLFAKPYLDGQIKSSILDSAVARVLRIKFELGLFDQPYIEAKSKNQFSDVTKHRELAKEAALKSIVLLKNDEKQMLPLTEKFKNIAIIGTDAIEARLGGYSGPGNSNINILDGLKKQGTNFKISFTEGCGRKYIEWVAVEPEWLSHDNSGKKEKGLLAEYFNNLELSGQPVLIRTDAAVNFQWTLFSPDPKVNYDFFSVRWNGFIASPISGKIKIGIEGNDGYKFYIDDTLILDTWMQQSYHATLVEYVFEKNKKYKIRIEYKEPAGNSWFRLIWNAGVMNNSENKIQEAVEVAKLNDVVIVVAGIDEGEFNDRSYLKLPGKQEEMILRICETGKPVIVVLVGGSAITMNTWLDKVNAVIDVWYPGEAGGEAIAEILTGKYCPSGKLPITFPMNEGQLPLVYNHMPTGRGDDYSDGSGQALFPFGFGLSYTQFEYSNLGFNKMQINSGDSLKISFTLKNTGNYDGEEVVQLYIYDELSEFVQPIKEMKGFQRVSLKVGEQKKISFVLTPEQFTTLDENLKTKLEPGYFRIMVGSSSKDIRLRNRIEIK